MRWLNNIEWRRKETKQKRKTRNERKKRSMDNTQLHASCSFATYCSHAMKPLFMSMSFLWHRPECDTAPRELQSTLQFAYREVWRHFWLRITSPRCSGGILTTARCKRERVVPNKTTILGPFSPHTPSTYDQHEHYAGNLIVQPQEEINGKPMEHRGVFLWWVLKEYGVRKYSDTYGTG